MDVQHDEERSFGQVVEDAMLERGFVDQRSSAPQVSIRQLAVAAGVGPSTASNVLAGVLPGIVRRSPRAPSPESVAKLADALGISRVVFAAGVGQARSLPEPYIPPPEADLLDERERSAVSELIQLLARRATDPDPDPDPVDPGETLAELSPTDPT